MNFKKHLKWLWLPTFWVALYLLFAFVRMEFDVTQWSQDLRFTFTLLTTLFSVLLSIAIAGTK